MEIWSGPKARDSTYVLYRADVSVTVRGADGTSVVAGTKTDRIRTDITDITFVFIFLSGFGFEYNYVGYDTIGYRHHKYAI